MPRNLYSEYKIVRVNKDLNLHKRYKIDADLAENIIKFLKAKANRLRNDGSKKSFKISNVEEVLSNHKVVLKLDYREKTIEIDRVSSDIIKESIFIKDIDVPEIKYYKLMR